MALSFESIRLHMADGVATLTLNRPDRLNSFTVAMHGEVRAALDAVDADRSVRCLVLTGAGRGFCAGQDLSDRAVAPGSDALDLGASIENHYKPLLLRLRALRMPTVCAVNGVAAGAGANIPFACDSSSRHGRRASSSRFPSSAWFPTVAVPGGCRAWSGRRARWALRCWATRCPRSRPWNGA